jgi:ERF superfamily
MTAMTNEDAIPITLIPPGELQHSTALEALAAALATAQGQMTSAAKDAENPFYKSKYADLHSVWDACRVPLASNGLAVIQCPRADGAFVSVETLLIHRSGQWVRGLLTAEAKDASPQAIGSAVTYLRRYALQSFVGVAPEDDDAEAAQPRPVRPMSGTRVADLPKADYSSVQAPAPLMDTEVPRDGPLLISRVDTAPTKKQGVIRARIKLSDGRTVATINKPLTELAQTLCDRREPVTVETKDTPFGPDLIALRRVGPLLEEPPEYDDSIPF